MTRDFHPETNKYNKKQIKIGQAVLEKNKEHGILWIKM